MEAKSFDVPILFVIFNRPETTERVFEAIRSCRPKFLYVAADGPRESRPGELARCEKARSIVKRIDWDCEVKTLFREKNLGCGVGVSSAITWFFQNVSEGIVLEDDCLPNPSFFSFCAELLEKYRNDLRIQSIGGTNIFKDWLDTDNSYIFTTESGVWGWASWANRWKDYAFDLDKMSLNDLLKKHHHAGRRKFVKQIFPMMLAHKIDTWDYQWLFCAMIHDRVCIVPRVNLISNIGFGSGATHTDSKESFLSELGQSEMPFPLVHPSSVETEDGYDRKISEKFYRGERNRVQRVFDKFAKAMIAGLILLDNIRGGVVRQWATLGEYIRLARLQKQCLLGDHVEIAPNAELKNFSGERSRLRVGDSSKILGELLVYPHGKLSLGESCYVGRDCKIWSSSNVQIGNRVLISHGVNIHDSNSYPLSARMRHRHEAQIFPSGHPKVLEGVAAAPVIIEDDAWIGFGASILKGVCIGKGAVVGAGTMVTKNVPAYAIVVGNPQRIVGEAKP